MASAEVARQDEEERARWTDRVRASELGVGKVIRDTVCGLAKSRGARHAPPLQRPPASFRQGQKTGGKGA
eukprot:9103944-Pyramimonas_sp.AAC.1